MFPMVLQFRSLLMSAGSLFVVIVAMAQNHFHELHLHLKTGRVGNSSVNSVSPLPQLVHVFGVFFGFSLPTPPPTELLQMARIVDST